jgi:methionine-rich copper-binding protein CopC
MARAQLEAIAGEDNTYEVDLSPSLPENVTLSASDGIASVFDRFEIDVTSLILHNATVTQSATENTAQVTLKANTVHPAGIYRARLICPLSTTKHLIEDVDLIIRPVTL